MLPVALPATPLYRCGWTDPDQPVVVFLALPLRERETVEIVIRTPQDVSEPTPALPADARHQALQRLLAMNLPVADWDQMEQEIVRGAIE